MNNQQATQLARWVNTHDLGSFPARPYQAAEGVWGVVIWSIAIDPDGQVNTIREVVYTNQEARDVLGY